MKRSIIENLLLVIAWAGLVGGVLFSLLYSKGIFESGTEMCVPRGLAYLVFGVGISVTVWALLKEVVSIADRLRRLEEKRG